MAWIRLHLQACYGRMFASNTLPLRGGMEANVLPTSCIIKITVLRLEKHAKSPEAAASNSFQSNRTVSDLILLERIPTELLPWKHQNAAAICNSNTCPHAAQAMATCRGHVAFSRLRRGSGLKYWAKDAERSWDFESIFVTVWGVMKCQTLTSLWGFFPKVGWLKFEVHGARGAAQESLSSAGWMWDYSFVWI